MIEPGPVTADVLRRMREVITTAIATRSMSILEAAAEARGLRRGLQPALPAEAVAAAVTGLLRELGYYQAPLAADDAAGVALSVRPRTCRFI
jgi:hypothetical protein